VHDQDLNMLKFPVHIENGFEFVDYSINFTGLCTNCRTARGTVGPR
jgi:hypothetical protein